MYIINKKGDYYLYDGGNKKCPECGGLEFKELECGDIVCSQCRCVLKRIFKVNNVRVLQKNMDKKDIETEIGNCVYQAGCIIETLEHMGLYQGNGHHAAQKIAQYAIKVFNKEV